MVEWGGRIGQPEEIGRNEVHILRTGNRVKMIENVLAGKTLKESAYDLGVKPPAQKITFNRMTEESGVMPKTAEALVATIVLSQPDPVGFVRKARDPRGSYFYFKSDLLENKKTGKVKDKDYTSGFMSSRRTNQWYEYRDQREIPDELYGDVATGDFAHHWTRLSSRFEGGRTFDDYISPREIVFLKLWGEHKSHTAVAKHMELDIQSVYHTLLHPVSFKLGISAGNTTMLQVWLESLCLGLLAPLPSPPSPRIIFPKQQ